MPVTSPGNTENDMLLTIAPMRRFSTWSTGAAEGAARLRGERGRPFGKLVADHVADEACAVEIRGGAGDHQPPVAQHGDAVGVAKRLLQRMRDEDHRDAALAQRLHEVEEMLRLLRRQRRRRLVEDDDARVVEHRAGDLDHLPLGRRQRARELRGVDVEVEPL